jgi:peptide/nickel transport system substrate-binding protein
MRLLHFVFAAAGYSLAVLSACAAVTDLRIGIGADVTAIDPHFHNVTPNNNVAAHF